MTPVGAPTTLKLTVPVNPPLRVMLTVGVVLPPCATDALVGDIAMAYEPVAGTVTV